MAKLQLSQTRCAAYRLQGFQLLFVGVLSVLLGLWQGFVVGYSIAMGGIACVVPGFYFAYRTLRTSGASQLRQIATAFWIAELLKVLLTAAVFYFAMNFMHVQFWALMIGFMGAQLFFLCVAPFILTKSV